MHRVKLIHVSDDDIIRRADEAIRVGHEAFEQFKSKQKAFEEERMRFQRRLLTITKRNRKPLPDA